MSGDRQTEPRGFKRLVFQPWGLVAMVLLGLLTIVGGLMFVVSLTPEKLAANDYRLPDGSILRIESVSWGRTHEAFLHQPRTYWELYDSDPPQPTVIRQSTPSDRLVVSMTRRDGRSGRPLDFDWWQSSHLIDAYGDDIREEKATLAEVASEEVIFRDGPRPLRADHRRFQSWCAQAFFPPFRSDDGRFTLKIENTAKQLVATIPLICTTLPTTPSWNAEELPATKSADELSMTLKGFENRPSGAILAGQLAASSPFLPKYELTWNGQPTEDWFVETAELTDAFGNSWNATTRLLSFKEPAWKLKVRVFHKPRVEVSIDRRWTSPEIEIPGDEYREVIRPPDSEDMPAIASFLIPPGRYRTPFGIGVGPEASAAGTTPSNVSGILFGRPFEISFPLWERRSRTFQTDLYFVETDSAWPCLWASIRRQTPDKLLELRVEDDHERNVPFESVRSPDFDIGWCFLNTPPDARSVRVTYIVQEARQFEFFVKPPELSKADQSRP